MAKIKTVRNISPKNKFYFRNYLQTQVLIYSPVIINYKLKQNSQKFHIYIANYKLQDLKFGEGVFLNFKILT